MKIKALVVSESDECDKFCEFVNLYPKLAQYLISIPNQALCYTNPGIRKKLSRQGVKKGIPDYFFAFPRNGYCGLFIEMKRSDLRGDKLRPEQQEWMDRLNSVGFKSIVCWGADEAIAALMDYEKKEKEEDVF